MYTVIGRRADFVKENIGELWSEVQRQGWKGSKVKNEVKNWETDSRGCLGRVTLAENSDAAQSGSNFSAWCGLHTASRCGATGCSRDAGDVYGS